MHVNLDRVVVDSRLAGFEKENVQERREALLR